ncbi:uncharacterized protein [Malus domestica]|uniref:uncharacterized protein n=1 Tax=Malus domestica TaxID=3750 RepID=UPI003975662C
MRTELMNTSRGDLSIADYLDKVNVLADNLTLFRALVSESDLVAIIISKVGPQYETTVTFAQAHDTSITYNALEALLLSADQCHNAFFLPFDVGTSAFAAVSGGGGASRGHGDSFRGGRSRGYPCGGGLSRNYTSDSTFGPSFSVAPPSRDPLSTSIRILGLPLGSNGSNSTPLAFFSSGRIQCQICKRYGHSTIDCFNRLNMP